MTNEIAEIEKFQLIVETSDQSKVLLTLQREAVSASQRQDLSSDDDGSRAGKLSGTWNLVPQMQFLSSKNLKCNCGGKKNSSKLLLGIKCISLKIL